ncbi:unnamed protein product [Cladocopium goreaui]|nr:unnamed protein product [Cladocopium goreaui]
MRQSSVQKDGITYAAAISGMDHWQLALALFEQMQRESIQRDHVSYNAAIAACGWREAVALLSEHHKPDAASFGACISACEKSGEWQAAIFLLACMSAALVPMTAVTVAAAISACEKCVQWTMALQIFAEAATTMQLDVVSYNAAIAACEKGSCWEAALTFMRRLPTASFQATAVTFSSVISSCAKSSRWREVMELLGKAPIWEPVSCGAAMRSCVHDWAKVLQLYHEMTFALVYKDADIYSTATTACARAGQVGQMHALLAELESVALNELKRVFRNRSLPLKMFFDFLQKTDAYVAAMSHGRAAPGRCPHCPAACAGRRRPAPGIASWPEALAFLTSPGALPLDVYALGAIVRACEQQGQWLAALGAIEVARQWSVQANVVVCNTAISACAKGQQWQWALELLQGMTLQGVQADVISYSSLVSGYAQARHWADALEVGSRRMAEEPSLPSPNGMTFSAAISACCEEQTWPWALGLLEDMQIRGSSVVVQTAILSALSFGGHWEISLQLAATLSRQQPLTLTTTNVLATALQRCAQWSLVLVLLQQMEQGQGLAQNCTADGITYAAAIAACGAGGRWQDALELWIKGPQNAILLNVAISACGDNLHWRGALQLLSNELSDTVSYNSAITACGNAGRWQHALALFDEMPRKVSVDLVTYNALISAMSPARQWLRALALLALAASATAPALRPNAVTYNAAVAAMEPWRHGLAVVGGALVASVQVDEIGMAAAISVCERGHVWQQPLG